MAGLTPDRINDTSKQHANINGPASVSVARHMPGLRGDPTFEHINTFKNYLNCFRQSNVCEYEVIQKKMLLLRVQKFTDWVRTFISCVEYGVAKLLVCLAGKGKHGHSYRPIARKTAYNTGRHTTNTL